MKIAFLKFFTANFETNFGNKLSDNSSDPAFMGFQYAFSDTPAIQNKHLSTILSHFKFANYGHYGSSSHRCLRDQK